MKNLRYTFFPGMHGTSELFEPISKYYSDSSFESVDYPLDRPQNYESLQQWLEEKIDWSIPRVLIAESFSGPLALRLAKRFPDSVQAVVLAASFYASPQNPNLALLPLRPLMSMRPPRTALRHFLLGEDSTKMELDALHKTIYTIPAKALSQRIRSILSLKHGDCPTLPHLPILILQALNDTIIPWAAQNQLHTNYDHATTHWIEAPHLILQKAPAECHAYISAFIEKSLNLVSHV